MIYAQHDHRLVALSILISIVAAYASVDPGMSNEVLSILTELIALHKSAKDFSSTGLVRLVGQ